MWTLLFWKATAERAVKTFCQVLLAVLGAEEFGLLHAPWGLALDLGLMAAVLSVLTSLVSALRDTDAPWRTPSLVRTDPGTPRHPVSRE